MQWKIPPVTAIEQSMVPVAVVNVPGLRSGKVHYYEDGHTEQVLRVILGWRASGKGVKPVHIINPTELLAGKVSLTTMDEVLEYVRAFSSPRHARALGYRLGIEVRRWDEVTSEWVRAGSPEKLRALSGEGAMGLCSRLALGRLGEWRPQVRKVMAGFEVDRLVIRPSGDGVWALYRVVELLGVDGTYKLLREDQKASAINWSIPQVR